MNIFTIAAQFRHYALVAVAFWLAPNFAAASAGHQHVHGVAELTLVFEGTNLNLEFTSPAASVVGFEHKASHQGQVEAVMEATAALQNGDKLFTFSGSKCSLLTVEVDMSSVLDADADGHPALEHDPEREPKVFHDEEDSSHTDIGAYYQYRCSDTSDLKTLEVGSDQLPFGLESIDIMWVSERGQGATVLRNNNRRVEFK